jgi:hypothetical protein
MKQIKSRFVIQLTLIVQLAAIKHISRRVWNDNFDDQVNLYVCMTVTFCLYYYKIVLIKVVH